MSPSKKPSSIDSCMLVGGEGCRKVTELNVLIQSYRETQLSQAEIIAEINKEIKSLTVGMERFLVQLEQSNSASKQQSTLQDAFRQNMHEVDMELQRVLEKVTSVVDTLKSITEYFNSAQLHCSDTRSGFEKRITELESMHDSQATLITSLTNDTKDAVDMVKSLKGAHKVMKFLNAGILGLAALITWLTSIGFINIGLKK